MIWWFLLLSGDVYAAATYDEADEDFIRFDIDKNGKLDAWELTLEYEGYLTSRAKHDFYRDVDTNNDGVIDREEYRKFVYAR